MISIKLFGWTSIFIVGLSVYVHEYHNAALSSLVAQFPVADSIFRRLNYLIENIIPTIITRSSLKDVKNNEILMTSRQLEEFNGKGKDGNLYLSILGQIFDVTKGNKHYGPGGGYHFFTGKDASRAFVTGDFSSAGLSDDVSNLSMEQLRGVKGWSDFYKKEYTYVGKLVGRYYDSQGYETPYLIEIKELLRYAELEREDAAAEKRKFPPCNSEWSVEKGSRVWCSQKSGGIERSWIGVPRKLYVLGSPTSRCACIRHPQESSSGESLEPTLNNPQLKEYPGCPKDSSSCWIKE